MSPKQRYVTSANYSLSMRWDDPEAHALAVSMRLVPPLAALGAVLVVSGPASRLLPELGAFAALTYAVLAVIVWFLAKCWNQARLDYAEAALAGLVADQINEELDVTFDGSDLVSLRNELRAGDEMMLLASREVSPGLRLVVDRNDHAYAFKDLS